MSGELRRVQKYWVYDWIDENRLTSPEEAGAALLNPKIGPKSLDAAAEDHVLVDRSAQGRYSVVAGRGADLSGELDCMHHECQIRQVDEILQTSLFYFDEINVAGLDPEPYAGHDRDWLSDELDTFLEHVWVLLDLRRRGLEDLLIFARKPGIESNYLAQAASLNMSGFTAIVGAWIDKFTREASIEIRRHQDHYHYTFTHDALEHTQWGHVHPRKGFRMGRREVARDVVGHFASALVSDIAAATQGHSALASRWIVHEDWLRTSKEAPSSDPQDVFLDLELPVPSGMSPEHFRRFRDMHADAFERFRHALALAIRERTGQGHAALAREVVEDIVEPSLREIRTRIDAADRSFARKVLLGSATSLGIVTVGLLTATPLLAPIAAAAGIPIITAAHSLLDQKAEIELNDMYFLWRLTTH